MDEARGLAEALLGLSQFRVQAVAEFSDELWISIETTADLVGCPRCGIRALAPRTQAGRPARPALIRPTGRTHLAQASLALC
jgi:hypothetical protein